MSFVPPSGTWTTGFTPSIATLTVDANGNVTLVKVLDDGTTQQYMGKFAVVNANTVTVSNGTTTSFDILYNINDKTMSVKPSNTNFLGMILFPTTTVLGAPAPVPALSTKKPMSYTAKVVIFLVILGLIAALATLYMKHKHQHHHRG